MTDYRKWFNIIVFSVLLSTAVLCIVNKFLFLPYVYDRNKLFLGNDVTTLFIGASHSEFSFDPDLVSNSYNVSYSGENLFFTYYKTKAILEGNPQISNVILAFSPSHISQYHEYNIFNKGNYRAELYRRYFYLLDNDSRKLLRGFHQDYIVNYLKYTYGVPIGIIDDCKFLLLHFLGVKSVHDYGFWGGHFKSYLSNLDDVMIRRKVQFYFYHGDQPYSKSTLMLEYLEKIILLCMKTKINIFLINTPSHYKYRRRIPQYFSIEYSKTVNDVKSRYPDANYFNFANLLIEDKCFFDGDHINSCGAEVLSRQINKIIKTLNHT